MSNKFDIFYGDVLALTCRWRGHARGGMAIFCRPWINVDLLADAQASHGLSHSVRKNADPLTRYGDIIKVMSP